MSDVWRTITPITLLPCSISSGALESLYLHLSYSVVTIAVHITIILIITLTSKQFQPLNQLFN